MLVFVAGFPAIYGKQPLYFADRIFQGTRGTSCAGERIMKRRCGVLILLGWLIAIALALHRGAKRAPAQHERERAARLLLALGENRPARRFVAVCPPRVADLRAGQGARVPRCAAGARAAMRLIKVLAAGPGDNVRIDASGVRVDGVVAELGAQIASMRRDAVAAALRRSTPRSASASCS